MPKETFYNLDQEKKSKITEVLISEFSEKPFAEVSVKTIVERLGIARGSFYQYFDNLEDSYFYILDQETYDVHMLFMQTLKNNGGDIRKSLDDFGKDIAEIIFTDDVYNLYKNRFLYWNEDLNQKWIQSHENYVRVFRSVEKLGIDSEEVNFFRAVVHNLIERNFREKWDKKTFIEKYNLHINWIKKGIINANI